MISSKSLNKIASALTPEVVEYIYNDARWIDFLMEITSDAVIDKMGHLDAELHGELCHLIMERIDLTGRDTCRTVY